MIERYGNLTNFVVAENVNPMIQIAATYLFCPGAQLFHWSDD